MSVSRGAFHSFPEGLHIVFAAFTLSDFTIHGLHFAAWKCNRLAPYTAIGVALMAFYISASLGFMGVGVEEWMDLALPEMERGLHRGNHTEKIQDHDHNHQTPVHKHSKNAFHPYNNLHSAAAAHLPSPTSPFRDEETGSEKLLFLYKSGRAEIQAQMCLRAKPWPWTCRLSSCATGLWGSWGLGHVSPILYTPVSLSVQ